MSGIWRRVKSTAFKQRAQSDVLCFTDTLSSTRHLATIVGDLTAPSHRRRPTSPRDDVTLGFLRILPAIAAATRNVSVTSGLRHLHCDFRLLLNASTVSHFNALVVCYVDIKVAVSLKLCRCVFRVDFCSDH